MTQYPHPKYPHTPRSILLDDAMQYMSLIAAYEMGNPEITRSAYESSLRELAEYAKYTGYPFLAEWAIERLKKREWEETLPQPEQ